MSATPRLTTEDVAALRFIQRAAMRRANADSGRRDGNAGSAAMMRTCRIQRAMAHPLAVRAIGESAA